MADNEKIDNDKGPTTTDTAKTEHGKTTDGDTQVNTIDKHAQKNLGGRDPSQPQTAMGDRDPKGVDRGQPDVTDPMTSRDPSKINQNPPQDKDAQESAGE